MIFACVREKISWRVSTATSFPKTKPPGPPKAAGAGHIWWAHLVAWGHVEGEDEDEDEDEDAA